jgi:hypothetical protein
MLRISDAEYAALEKRVADGKVFLKDKWGAKDMETVGYIKLWHALSNQLLEQMQLRGVFTTSAEKPSPNRIPGETPDEYVDRIKEKMILEGKFRGKWTKPWLRAYQAKKKGGKEPTHVQTRSESNSLFATS